MFLIDSLLNFWFSRIKPDLSDKDVKAIEAAEKDYLLLRSVFADIGSMKNDETRQGILLEALDHIYSLCYSLKNRFEALQKTVNHERLTKSIESSLYALKMIKLILDGAYKEDTSIKQELEDVVMLLRRQVEFSGKTISVKTDFAPDLAPVYANPIELHRVFLNLGINAIEAIEGQEGKIRISANIDENNENIIIQFEDNGKGIPEENLGKIFNPGFTTKSTGTGLGLDNVKTIIENHGGKVTVDSQEGKATVFTVYLPIKPNVSGSPVGQARVSSLAADNALGGIDMRALPQHTKIEQISAAGPLKNASTGSGISSLINNKDWKEIQKLLNAGIKPSLERVIQCLLDCKDNELNSEVDQALSCIASIFRLEEDSMQSTDQALKQVVILLESDKPAEEIKVALADIKITEKEPVLVQQ